jgi:putative redox protein
MNKMAFEASVNGHNLILDASGESGGENLGPRPKMLLLAALGGCTGMDVVSLLAKMRVEYKSLNIKVEGETAEEHPKKYLKMKVIFSFVGKDLNIEKIRKAVDLSKEKYCSVSATMKPNVVIDYDIKITEE